METKIKPKFKVGTTLLLSLAVFAQEISFNFYDSQVPPLLEYFIPSIALVGFLMGIDNLIGLFLEPIVGNLSDNTKAKLGRRLPYLLIGVPLSAIAFVFIPYAAVSLPTLLTTMLLYITTMLAFKAPAESLVPDFIVPEHRSKANALIKSMTAFSIIIAAVLSEVLYDDYPEITFMIPAIIMIICLIVVLTTVKEKNSLRYKMEKQLEERGEVKPDTEKISFFKSFGAIFKKENRDILFLLISVFFMAVSWSSVRSLLTLYGVNALGMLPGDAGGMSLYAGIVFILLVFLIAWLSEKFNRLLFFKIGFGVFIIGFILGYLWQTEMGTIIATCVIAVGYGFVGANAIVILWNYEPNKRASGTYTGIFYVFFYGAYTVGGFMVGGLIDLENYFGLSGWSLMMLNAGLFVLIGGIFALFVKPKK